MSVSSDFYIENGVLVDYRGEGGDVIIPDDIKEIGDYAFSGCAIKSLTVHNNLSRIGKGAFKNCGLLSSVCIGEEQKETIVSLSDDDIETQICEIAFQNCTALKTVELCSCVSIIGKDAFAGCNSLEELTIPNSVSAIGGYAFSDCSSLTSITIGSSVSVIGEGAFSNCGSLTSITIPNSVRVIGKSAFRGSNGLKSVEYSGSLADWCKIEFGDKDANPVCYSGKISIGGVEPNCLTISEDIDEVSAFAFGGCSSLTRVMIAEGVTKIGKSAFEKCENVTKAIIAESVREIGDSAFASCGRLVKAVISDGVKLGKDVFADCPNISVKTKKPERKKVAAYNPEDFYMEGSVLKKYKGSASEVIIPDGVREIDGGYLILGGVFGNCKDITSITIPNSVSVIGDRAFYECSGLTSITIPDGVTSIGDDAFYECSGLTSITIPDGVTSIGKGAFFGCKSLTSITIGSSVSVIDKSAFGGCSSLTSITIPNSVSAIGGYAFSCCSSLESIAVAGENKKYHSSGNCIIETESKTLIVGCKNSVIPPDGRVSIIGEGAFCGCSSLEELTIPDGVSVIDKSAFNGCSSLESIAVASGNKKYHSSGNCIIETESKTLIAGCKNSVIPSDGSVSDIGWYAFYGCRSLTRITIPNSVSAIGFWAFYGCRSLTRITIPNSVSAIGNYAFCGCSSLEELTIPDGVSAIGESTFHGCSSLTSITIPSGVKIIGKRAFLDCSSLTSIVFRGKKSKWKAITKREYWDGDTGTYTIYCTNGDIEK